MIELKKLLRIESTDYYPLVYIPNHIKKQISDNNFYNVEDSIIKNKYDLTFYYTRPTPPTKPKEPDKYKYVEYEETKYRDGFRSTLIFALIFSIIGLSALSKGMTGMFLIYLAVVIIAAIILKSKYSIEKKTQRVDLSENEKLQSRMNYEVLIKDYERDLMHYNNEVKIFDLHVSEFQSRLIPFKDQYIYEKYLQEIKSKITFNRNNDIVKRGKSEDRFLEYLLSAFEPDDLKINIAVNTYSSAFYPDFLFVSKDKDFCIDIEIDERYDYKTKKPIHFIGSDDERNNFFLDKNCFIVKFTEEQVTEQPDKCCLFIKEIVNVISKPQSYDLNTYIQQIKPWTFEEAYLQAKSNFRNNY